jgi:hypothetical protein|tara:strand:- start:207 stop:395 length:189 start_codon:yes stop_codon:yes gene_type:complete
MRLGNVRGEAFSESSEKKAVLIATGSKKLPNPEGLQFDYHPDVVLMIASRFVQMIGNADSAQ